MSRAIRQFVVPLVLAGACSQAEPPPRAPTSPIGESLGPIPRVQARVRVVAPHLGPGWRTGMFNQTRTARPCYLILLFDPGKPGMIAGTVYIPSVTRLQVSSLYRGLGGQPMDPDPGAGAFDAEEWIEMAVDSVRTLSHDCPPTTDSAAGLPPPPAQSAPCRPKVTPRPTPWRGLPQSFYDQGRSSLPALFPRHRLLAEYRDGRIGNVEYSLLVFQATPIDSVTLEAVAVEWESRARAWDLGATCSFNAWSGGLVTMLEALATLPTLPKP